ncbi:MAG TPA: MFS transporter [Pseudoalteromonas sp.]|uniref:Major facilitator superfamily (MFS) profile domain-containing protein n=1 Tax=marine sediment metagenome TaxID=412755 RepID=A0A0F9PUJ6_9ZZZZ|nr:MFS transporter [Pseudoalteromonas sp.]HDY91231.1 MFS transporter [Pseudoalteromonas sp.]HDZ31729.1 MFS transporter [Pseudoalteromonas sp.]
MPLLLILIYLAFISLGLPDSLIGPSWPSISNSLNSSTEFAGVVAIVVSIGTVISSLLTTRLINLLGTGKVVAISVLFTAVALLGFSIVNSIWLLLILAIPLGLGGGAVDSALNNYVATHYKAKHMNFLHSFWGVGASAGPFIMSFYLMQQEGWRNGYSVIACVQIALVIVLFLALPQWNKAQEVEQPKMQAEPLKAAHLSNSQALKIKGVKLQLLLFFCYCALETGTGLWAASFLIAEHNVSISNAAFYTALYYLGITFGRFTCGFIADKVDEKRMIRTGVCLMFLGALLLILPLGVISAKLGLILIGLGCAPVYPNTIHLTPTRFGKHASQAVISLSMAVAYLGSTFMPPLMGYMASTLSFIVLPFMLLTFSLLMIFTSERLTHVSPKGDQQLTRP